MNQRDKALRKLAPAGRESWRRSSRRLHHCARNWGGCRKKRKKCVRGAISMPSEKAMASKSATKEALDKEEKQRIRTQ
eukprot:451037-Pleurochrysis_carterae.AAC.3